MKTITLSMLCWLLWFATLCPGQQVSDPQQEAAAASKGFVSELDIIYRKQDGYALTMDRVAPESGANGAAVVMVMSGGWVSRHSTTQPLRENALPGVFKQQAEELLGRGYTLFYVVHGTQPKFTIREILEQISEAVRFIRSHAKEYNLDPQRIGIMGGSAGGHLSLMQGTKGEDADGQRESDRVQAVVAYFPPTDFVNYGEDGVFFDKVVREVLGGKNPFLQAMDYWELDSENVRWTQVQDESRVQEHYRFIAPFYHVSPDDAPTLILHGDADRLVPLQQAQRIVEKLNESGVENKLFVQEGGNHGWPASDEECQMIVDWFDKYLLDE
ncbi:MAG: alpha/beta hydrolase [bacterium]|nr:alpha/beta hydrolase [bacterium]